MRIVHQHKNERPRKLYKAETGLNPLHLQGDKWFKNEYVLWMEDKLEQALKELDSKRWNMHL